MNRQHLYPKLFGLLALLLYVAAARGQTYQLEYWFDTYSQANAHTTSFSGTNLSKSLDVNSIEQGFHTIYMRVKSSDGTYSPITSSVFFKYNVSGSSNLQYWFDDDISKMATIPIDMTSDAVQVLDLNMTDAVKFPLGFHKLCMRIAANGSHYSPIYTAYVMRLAEGQASQITYWLDDDYANRHVVGGIHVNSSTYLIGRYLDFSTASVGMHRFKYRITRNGFDDGVIYEVPVLITKKYNSMGEVAIVSESHWLDDNSPMENSISNPGSLITKSYILDPATFSVGQHAFHVQYKNSSDVWGEQNITYFYKEELTGRLRLGFKPGTPDGIDNVTLDEHFVCFYERGTIYVDCQSPKLASAGIVQVYDLTGKLVASQAVSNSDGIHAEINAEGYAKQILIVRLSCGDVLFNKKIVVQ